ncbi:protein jag [Dehalococcoidia bacterium]|nr:protein jag [Dehalococcoidia bacterium]
MNEIQISAKTIDEALELALRELDAEREEVAVEIINQGRAGIFGIGAEAARVRVTRLSNGEGLASEALVVVNQLLSRMKSSDIATISSSGTTELGPTIDIRGEDSGLLIGKRGETLHAFQFLVNMFLNKNHQGHPVVTIDVEKYKERRNLSLQTLAKRVAERVMTSGHAVTLEPMFPAERRIIHITLSNHPSISTESTGNGPGRKVTIMLRKGNH